MSTVGKAEHAKSLRSFWNIGRFQSISSNNELNILKQHCVPNLAREKNRMAAPRSCPQSSSDIPNLHDEVCLLGNGYGENHVPTVDGFWSRSRYSRHFKADRECDHVDHHIMLDVVQ